MFCILSFMFVFLWFSGRNASYFPHYNWLWYAFFLHSCFDGCRLMYRQVHFHSFVHYFVARDVFFLYKQRRTRPWRYWSVVSWLLGPWLHKYEYQRVGLVYVFCLLHRYKAVLSGSIIWRFADRLESNRLFDMHHTQFLLLLLLPIIIIVVVANGNNII